MSTGPGFTDANGIWQYGEDDAETLMSDLLNIGQQKTSDVVAATDARLDDLEADSGWVSLAVESGYAFRSGLSTPLHHVRRMGSLVFLRLHMDFTVGDWSGSSTTIATIPDDYWPDYEVRWMGFRTANSSSPLGGWITPAGEIKFQKSASPVAEGTHFSVLAQPWIKA